MNKADSSRALLILALICTAYLLIPFHRMTPSIMSAAIMAETGMGPVMIGFLSSILFLTFGIMQMVGGLLVDSYGPRRILPCFLLAATAGTALFALSTSAPGLLLGRAIIGFGTSVIFVSGLKLFNAWFPPTVYARLNGLLLGMGGLGLVIGSGGMGYLCDGLGWRTSHLIVALITFCFALALAWIVRDTPGHASRPTPAGRAGAAPWPCWDTYCATGSSCSSPAGSAASSACTMLSAGCGEASTCGPSTIWIRSPRATC